jgi:hypothetical protein
MFAFFQNYPDFTFKVKNVKKTNATLQETKEALKPKDIAYLPYPAAVDRDEQIALAEASAMQMSMFAF